MKKLYISIVTALLSGTAMLVAAQGLTYRQQGPAPFEVYDRNGDGAITAEEFNAFRDERRAARAAEGRPMRNAGTAPTFEQVDAQRGRCVEPRRNGRVGAAADVTTALWQGTWNRARSRGRHGKEYARIRRVRSQQ